MINELILSTESTGSLVLAAYGRTMIFPGSVLVFQHVAWEVVLALYCYGAERAGGTGVAVRAHFADEVGDALSGGVAIIRRTVDFRTIDNGAVGSGDAIARIRDGEVEDSVGRRCMSRKVLSRVGCVLVKD